MAGNGPGRAARRPGRKRPPGASGTGGEGAGVLDGLERLPLRVRVGAGDARDGVLDGEVDPDVGEAAGEDPVALVQGAAVDDLDDGLDVGGAEEPQIAGIGRQADAGGAAGGAGGCV